MIGFEALRGRLVEKVRRRIQNGELTERALALKVDISQPHLHNLLKGVRAFNARSSDRLLAGLAMSALDLLETDELRRTLLMRARAAELSIEVPVLKDRLGPGLPWPDQPSPFERVPVPIRYLSRLDNPVVARLAHDETLTPLLSTGDLVLLDSSPEGLMCPDPEALFAVILDGQVCLRWVRRGRGSLYLIRASCRNAPHRWERSAAPWTGLIRARAIPLHWMYEPELLRDPLLPPRDTPRVPARPSAAS